MRNKRHANAAGYATVADWIADIDGKPMSPAAAFRQAARAFAERAVRRHDWNSGRMYQDLLRTAKRTIRAFFKMRLARFPKWTAGILSRFANCLLPRPTLNRLRRALRRALEIRIQA